MRYCGRQFSDADLELIRSLIVGDPTMSRLRLSKTVCDRLDWRRPNGALKDMSCRVALLRMQKDGLVTLPPPRLTSKLPYAHYRSYEEIEQAASPPIFTPEVDLGRLTVEIVSKSDSRLWNAYIQLHHYLGFQPLSGAQLRYFIRSEGEVVALLSFGASAWKVKPRDEYIGWSHEQRKGKLHLVVNNARFLIPPWIKHYNLASRVLGVLSRRIGDDWYQRYGYRPVLLETFVDEARYNGGCYRAANWHRLGVTQGRGKLDPHKLKALPVKSIWVYPLVRNYRNALCC